MYGNMWGGPVGPMMGPNIGRMGMGNLGFMGRGFSMPGGGLGMMRRGAGGLLGRTGGLGLMGRIGNGMSAVKGINWGNLLNNASRALGVVNQTIPLVRQAGPMFNNMKSMFRIASAFKDVTDDDAREKKKETIKKETSNVSNYNYNYNMADSYNDISRDSYQTYGNEPNFFI